MFLTRRDAFTLIELAVVLVIIGLIVGGVLVGKDLIRNAERQSVITEKNRFSAAFYAFQAKYNAIPGDMSNAHQYFGDACGTNSTASNTGCNGNGNGSIKQLENDEHLKVWEHLSRAGLIAGEYDGTGIPDGSGSGILSYSVTNSPPSRLTESYWALDGELYNAMVTMPRYLHLGGISTVTSYSALAFSPSLTHSDALSIDTKIDDGAANSGSVSGDGAADCFDDGTDYYSLLRMGADYTGDCILHFSL